MTTSVLIVGAGPTGLVLGIWLKKQGIDIRIVDKNEGLATTSRATVVHARTLELYSHLGLTDRVKEGGQRAEAMCFWLGGCLRARLKIGAIGQGLTAYPYMYFYPQDRHEKLLTEVAQELGINVERNTELIAFHDHGNHVTATLRNRDGLESTIMASYIVECDGSHSTVRHTMGVDFVGSQYHRLFYVADIEGHGTALNGEAHGVLDDADGFLIFPYAEKGHCRVVGMVRDERVERADTLTFDDVSHGVLGQVQLELEKVNWFSTYQVHHRLASHFRHGRAFIAGDAAHIHSPVGGQGMNTGIGDAINLAWKLASVLKGQASETILDSYEIERRAFASRLVATTDRAFSIVTSDSYLAGFFRRRIAPLVMPWIFSLPLATKFMFRTVSQLSINYRSSPISVRHTFKTGVRIKPNNQLLRSEGPETQPLITRINSTEQRSLATILELLLALPIHIVRTAALWCWNCIRHVINLAAGADANVCAGDRLPWVVVNGVDNYSSFENAMNWQVHIYGAATEELKTWVESSGVYFHNFAWTSEHRKAGFVENSAYLLRPDGYVAVAEMKGDGKVIAKFFEEHMITVIYA